MKRLFISRAIRLRSRVPGGSAMSEARRHRIVAWWSVAVFASAFGSNFVWEMALSRLGSVNWVMGMAERRVRGGHCGVRS